MVGVETRLCNRPASNGLVKNPGELLPGGAKLLLLRFPRVVRPVFGRISGKINTVLGWARWIEELHERSSGEGKKKPAGRP